MIKTNYIKLKNLTFKIGSGITPTGGSASYKKQGIPFIRSQNVRFGRLDLDGVAYIDQEQHEKMSNSIVKPGDVLLNITGASIGRSCVVPDYIIEANVNQHVCIIRATKELNSSFLSHFFNSPIGQKQIWSFQGGGSREGLNYEQIASFKIPYMSVNEQKAMAATLSIWDEAIEKTERLIELKEKQFRWLTTQIFLKNPEIVSWNCSSLNKLARVKKGEQLNRTELDKEGDYPAWNGGIRPSGYTDTWNTEENTVTISEGGNSCGFVNYSRMKFWCGGHCYSLMNVDDQINTEFLYFYLKTKEKQIMSLRVGSGLPNIQKGDIEKFEIAYPNLKKQNIISNKLNTVQSEIMLIRRLLNFYRQQKQGLMQKLLTGKWRVNFKDEK